MTIMIANSTKNKFLILYAHCVPVRGKEKGAIYDFHRGKLTYVPNSMIDLIEHLQYHKIKESAGIVNSEAYLNEYLDFLLKEDLCFSTNQPQQFPRIDFQYFSPEKIKNAVLEYIPDTYNIKEVMGDLNQLFCRHLEVRFPEKRVSYKEIVKVLEAAKDTTMRSIDLHFSLSDFVSAKQIEDLSARYTKVNFVSIYNAEYDSRNYETKIAYLTADFEKIAKRHFPQNVFIVNLNYFAESQHYNPYFNKKVCIDQNGNIKNCLLHEKVYGHVSDRQRLQNIDKDTEFTWLWGIKPDMIEEVKDMESRYCAMFSQNISFIDGKYKLIA